MGTVKQHDQICIVERLLWQMFGGKTGVGETEGKGPSSETRAVVPAGTDVGLNGRAWPGPSTSPAVPHV